MQPRKPSILPRKVAAFTIMELLVVMILSTFVFSMALMAYQIMGGLYRNYEETSTSSVELDRFRALIGRDIAASKALYYDAPTLFCQYEGHYVSYQFGPSGVVRSGDLAERLDSVYHGPSSINSYFEQEEIMEGEIDQIHIEIRFFEQALPLDFEKAKDAAYYLNRPNRYEH
jgi:hypothetical protein